MKRGLLIAFLYSIGVMELAGAPNHQQLHHGALTPKLTLVATVDDKAFFVDTTTEMNYTEANRAQARTYCATLGIRIAEIPSARQFSALDEAVVENWKHDSCVWTGGVETKKLVRYAWENSTLGLYPSYIPYAQWTNEVSNYFLFFRKRVNNSFLQNATPTHICTGTLCETLSTGHKTYI